MVEQTNETSAMLSWPDLKNFTINSKMVSHFKVKYNSTYLKETCHEDSFKTNVEVCLYTFIFYTGGILCYFTCMNIILKWFIVRLQDALNKSHIMVYKLRRFCQNYTFQVSLFRIKKGGLVVR